MKSDPNLRLRPWMCTSTALLSTSSPQPYSLSSICARDRMFPGRSSSSCSSANSFGTASISRPSLGDPMGCGIQGDAQVLDARRPVRPDFRRSSARIRAASSSRSKGLTR